MDNPSTGPDAPQPVPPGSSPTPGSTPPPPPPSAGAESSPGTNSTYSKDERFMASLAHIGGILLCFIAPLVIWFWKREESAFIDDQAKEAVNFQITVAIVLIASVVLTIIPFIGCIFFAVFMVAWVASIVLAIIGAMKANEGVKYRYPVALRLVK